jgi:hypothetical protein
MNIDALGNIGDFLGGLGVIVTLVYLALQVRQNTITSKTNSYQEAVSAVSEWSREVGVNSEATDILLRGSLNQEDLSPQEQMRFNLLMSAYLRNMENLHMKFLTGAVDSVVWDGWETRLRTFFHNSPGMITYWNDNQSVFSPKFRRTVDAVLASSDKINPVKTVSSYSSK